MVPFERYLSKVSEIVEIGSTERVLYTAHRATYNKIFYPVSWSWLWLAAILEALMTLARKRRSFHLSLFTTRPLNTTFLTLVLGPVLTPIFSLLLTVVFGSILAVVFGSVLAAIFVTPVYIEWCIPHF